MFFKPYYLGCLSHASYLIGGSNGEAVVIDPRRDVEEYLADADAVGLQIKHVIETHLHADFVSGHLELADRTGAAIYMGAKAGASFPHHAVHDGDVIPLGDVTIHFMETPGHTPEGICALACVKDEPSPRMAFTGDTLFIGDVGRPDLAGGRGYTPEQMARMMYQSLREKLLALPDEVEVWPAHGAGSSCGRALSDEKVSTISREKATNPALQPILRGDEEEFVRYAVEGLSPAPAYFSHDALQNRQGAAPVQQMLTSARPLSEAEIESLSEDGVVVLDTRTPAAFGSGHVPGAINIGLDGNYAPWVGRIVAPDAPIIVVTETDCEKEAMTRLARVGYESIIGWMAGGMDAWRQAGGQIVTVPQMEPDQLQQRLSAPGDMTLLDVRSKDEWEAGHVAGAIHIPLPELEQRISDVPEGPLAVMCRSGYRSTIATSILQRHGRRGIHNAAGGWTAWMEATEKSAAGHAEDARAGR